MKHRILLVDDDSTGPALASTLKRRGYETVLCTNGGSALHEITDCTEYDMALVDQQLSDMDGRDVIKTVKEKNPKIYVICWSGYEYRRKFMSEFDADEYVPKAGSRILNAITSYFERYHIKT